MSNIPGKFVFYIVQATNNCLSESILLRCTKYSLEIKLQELSSPLPRGQSEQFSLKSMKEIYIPAKIINPCQFITDPLKSSRNIIHTLKASGQLDCSFENESTMCKVIAVMIAK